MPCNSGAVSRICSFGITCPLLRGADIWIRRYVMTSLVLRDNLFQDLFDFRRDFDQILNGMVMEWPFHEERINGTSAAFAPAVESYIDKDGVLEITAPVAASALPRRIEVKTAPISKQIAA